MRCSCIARCDGYGWSQKIGVTQPFRGGALADGEADATLAEAVWELAGDLGGLVAPCTLLLERLVGGRLERLVREQACPPLVAAPAAAAAAAVPTLSADAAVALLRALAAAAKTAGAGCRDAGWFGGGGGGSSDRGADGGGLSGIPPRLPPPFAGVYATRMETAA